MDDQTQIQNDYGFQSFPTLVSFASPIHTPSSRRLSSNFTQPRPPVSAARRLAWISLEGRLVNAEEASSARSIGGGLSRNEAVAWQMFSPLERFLVVAVIGVAVSESKKNHQIGQLKKAVELRDQVLLSMQHKLDDLCDQVNHVKDQPGTENDMSLRKDSDFADSEIFGHDKIKFVDCGCWLCDQHSNLFGCLEGNHATKQSVGAEVLQYKLPLLNEPEQEERRMSDLSDWASSVTSAAEIQLNSLTFDQDICSMKKDCDEKDATIKELTTLLHSSKVSGSQRISELEDIIRRKNQIISKLKKDMVTLEQKVIHLTRLRRPSSSASNSDIQPLPHMTANVLYDMENSTSSSSSDSDCSPSESSQPPPTGNQVIRVQNRESSVIRNQKLATKKGANSSVRPADYRSKPHTPNPLREITVNRKPEIKSTSRTREVPHAGGDSTKTRRRFQTGTKDTPSRKRDT